jgi:hypothetical protein
MTLFRYVYIYIHVPIFKYTFTHEHIYVYTPAIHVSIFKYTCTHIHIYIHIYTPAITIGAKLRRRKTDEATAAAVNDNHESVSEG